MREAGFFIFSTTTTTVNDHRKIIAMISIYGGQQSIAENGNQLLCLCFNFQKGQYLAS
jgi:hypothetical protein